MDIYAFITWSKREHKKRNYQKIREEKRLILATITDKITFNEDTNTLSVQLKPIFEHLRQIKMQEKKAFSENLFTLHRTLESRSKSAKKALQNDVKKY